MSGQDPKRDLDDLVSRRRAHGEPADPGHRSERRPPNVDIVLLRIALAAGIPQPTAESLQPDQLNTLQYNRLHTLLEAGIMIPDSAAGV